MRQELYASFNQICRMAAEISSLPELGDEQVLRVFGHVSNTDMETTVRTIRYAYHMIKQEAQ